MANPKKHKTEVKNNNPDYLINSHEQSGVVVSQIVQKTVNFVLDQVKYIHPKQQWLIYARVMNSLFCRLYNPAVNHAYSESIKQSQDIAKFFEPRIPKKHRKTNRTNAKKK